MDFNLVDLESICDDNLRYSVKNPYMVRKQQSKMISQERFAYKGDIAISGHRMTRHPHPSKRLITAIAVAMATAAIILAILATTITGRLA